MSKEIEYLEVPDDDDFDAGYVFVDSEDEEQDFPGHGDIPEDLSDFE